MSFSRIYTGWVDGSLTSGVITASQVNQFHHNLARGVDGIGGGSYYLTNTLVFQGSAIQIGAASGVYTSRLSVADDLTFSSTNTYAGCALSTVSKIILTGSAAGLSYRTDRATIDSGGTDSAILDITQDVYYIGTGTVLSNSDFTVRLNGIGDGGREPQDGQRITIVKADRSGYDIIAYRGTSTTSKVFQMDGSNAWAECTYVAADGWICTAWSSGVGSLEY